MANKQNSLAVLANRKRLKELRMNIIAPLYKHGYTCREIRLEVMKGLGLQTYSLSTVQADINSLTGEWHEQRQKDFDKNMATELARIDELIKECWEAWEKSKEDYDARSQKQKGVPNSTKMNDVTVERMELILKQERCCGDVRYIEMINKLLIERRKLLGLYAAEKREVTGTLDFERALLETSIVEDEEG